MSTERSCCSPASLHVHSSRCEANYRRERKKLPTASLISPSCSFYRLSCAFPGKSPAEERTQPGCTFISFGSTPPEKTLCFDSSFLLCVTLFPCHLPVVCPAVHIFASFFNYIFVLLFLVCCFFITGPGDAMCFMEANLQKWIRWNDINFSTL